MVDPTLRWMARRFWARERRLRATGALVLALLASLLIWWLFALGWGGALTAIPSLLPTALVPFGYVLWGIANARKGLVGAPRVRWRVEVAEDTAWFFAYDRSAALPLGAVVSGHYVFDGGFDQLRGVEGVMTLQLVDGTRLPIHEEADGRVELWRALKGRGVTVTVIDVDDSV